MRKWIETVTIKVAILFFVLCFIFCFLFFLITFFVFIFSLNQERERIVTKNYFIPLQQKKE